MHSVPGLTRPYQYLATGPLPFSMHVEDMGLDSVNTLLAGALTLTQRLSAQFSSGEINQDQKRAATSEESMRFESAKSRFGWSKISDHLRAATPNSKPLKAIVFVFSVVESQEIAKWLRTECGIPSTAYYAAQTVLLSLPEQVHDPDALGPTEDKYAGGGSKERLASADLLRRLEARSDHSDVQAKIWSNFHSGAVQVLVATKAIQFGVDTSGVNRIIFFEVPVSRNKFTRRSYASPYDVYQQMGWAGRDGTLAVTGAFVAGLGPAGVHAAKAYPCYGPCQQVC